MSEETKPALLPPGWPTGTATPEDFVKAHQYLYYVKSDSVWSDLQYDTYCKEHGLFGGGGSDSAADYPESIVRLAEGIWRYHHQKDKTPAATPAPKPRKARAKKTETAEPEEISFV